MRSGRPGIRLVIAESFERIYRENCQNLGIFTSTDFELLDLLLGGQPIPLERFTGDEGAGRAGRDRAAGGLLPYSKARLAGRVRRPPGRIAGSHDTGREDHRPALGRGPGPGGSGAGRPAG